MASLRLSSAASSKFGATSNATQGFTADLAQGSKDTLQNPPPTRAYNVINSTRLRNYGLSGVSHSSRILQTQERQFWRKISLLGTIINVASTRARLFVDGHAVTRAFLLSGFKRTFKHEDKRKPLPYFTFYFRSEFR
ncbi:hypothetical protein CBL_03327 [Carabus blaptoides fortunei]